MSARLSEAGSPEIDLHKSALLADSAYDRGADDQQSRNLSSARSPPFQSPTVEHRLTDLLQGVLPASLQMSRR
jgi:hypothetical protein